jgi:transposase
MAKTKHAPDAKTETLRRHGTLHPRPAGVTDELFGNSDFFDRRDLVQVRYEMLRRVRTEGRPVNETAGRFGVSRPTYYKLDADFTREGLNGLLPRKRGPKGGHKLTDEIAAQLAAALDDDPSLDTASLVLMVRERFGIEVHPRSIERALLRQKKKASAVR